MADVGIAPFVGRSRELATLGELFLSGARLISITGRGGVGKSRLAREAVARLQPARRAIVVPLAGLVHADAVLPAVAAAAGIDSPPGVVLAERLAAGPPAVLVLDGCERVREAGHPVQELLEAAPDLVVLVTSQRPLGLTAEVVVRVGPLPVPDPGVDGVAALADVPAVALYCQRARAADHRFELTASNAAAVSELCRRLDGLPLALELAGGRAATLSVEDLVRRPDGGLLDLLRSAARPDGLRTVIESTCDLLGPRERGLLGRLSVLAGPFGLDVAEAHGDEREVLDDLSTLVDLHLVDPIDGPDGRRFVVPATIRAHVGEGVDAAAHRTASTEWCAAMAWRAAEQPEESGWVDAEHHLLEDALRDALDRGSAETAARLVAGLAPFWDRRGYHGAAQQLVERTLALTAGLTTKAAVQALTWSALLGLHYVRAEPAIVAERIERALALAVELGDEREELRALSARLLLAPYTGDLDGARTSAERGLELARCGGHEGWQARFEVWAGMLAHQSGERDRALELGRAGIDRARRLGDDVTLVHASLLLLPLIGARRRPGDPSVDEALAAARRTGALNLELALLPVRTARVLATGDLTAAARAAAEALVIARPAPSAPATAFNLMAAAGVLERIEPVAAARIHGAVYSKLSAIEGYLPRSRAHVYGEMLDRLRETLGAKAFDAAVAEGGALSIAQCIDETLARLPADEPPPVGPAAAPAGLELLTPRERDVLDRVVAGRTNREIAAELSLSTKTVMHHTGAIYRKLHVRGRAEAIARSLRAGVG